MGALLSLPLLAVPSVGTVRIDPLDICTELTRRPAYELRCFMLWGGSLLRDLQPMRHLQE